MKITTTMLRENDYNAFEDFILNMNYKASKEELLTSYAYLSFEDLLYYEIMKDELFERLVSKR